MYLLQPNVVVKVAETAKPGAISDWLSLVGLLVWPTFLGFVLFFWRREIRTLLNRISSVEAGGVKVELTAPEDITNIPEVGDHPRQIGFRP
jgi:hypothetical protein